MSRSLPELGEDCKGLAKNAAGQLSGFWVSKSGEAQRMKRKEVEAGER
ncbi:hypothetical protein FOYG_09530 [Fusarium oxysporum NRRL 32931]|uniref:Uncharacterized protein n=1 Tax=Fusarium oxysporum NRRL 32931 TaxID=660029 RepID=W9I071_FUSOX|nr:hypothetical protein FOYG_09530 [Fusarium oxysporum NRRL 32931]